MMTVSISFINFYRGFEPSNSFISYIIAKATNGDYAITQNNEDSDVTITSVYGNTPTDRRKTILYTPENVRPNFYKVRYSLSHDQDTWFGKNCYCPFWLSKLDWEGYHPRPETKGIMTHQNEKPIKIRTLYQTRKITESSFNKKKFCAIVAGNPETFRMNAYGFLRNYDKIDGYGHAFSNPILTSKHQFLSKYRFVICPENSFYPGYVTEKLFDAWYAGTIPIYFGGIGTENLINQRAFLSYNTEDGISALYHDIKKLNENYLEYKKVFCENILYRPPTLERIINFMRGAVQKITAP